MHRIVGKNKGTDLIFWGNEKGNWDIAYMIPDLGRVYESDIRLDFTSDDSVGYTFETHNQGDDWHRRIFPVKLYLPVAKTPPIWYRNTTLSENHCEGLQGTCYR